MKKILIKQTTGCRLHQLSLFPDRHYKHCFFSFTMKCFRIIVFAKLASIVSIHVSLLKVNRGRTSYSKKNFNHYREFIILHQKIRNCEIPESLSIYQNVQTLTTIPKNTTNPITFETFELVC